MAEKIDGIAALRRTIRGLPDAARAEMADVLDEGSLTIQRLMLTRAPRRTGRMRTGIRRKLSRAALTVLIGLVGSQQERRKLFYGRILDLGRRAQVVKAVRRSKSGKISRYRMRVGAIAPKRFITGQYSYARGVINDKLRGIWQRILSRAG